MALRLLAFMHGLRSGVPCGHRSREARGSESTEDGGHGLRLTLATTEADTQAFGGAQTASLSEWPSESAVEGHPGRRAYRRAASRSLMRQLLEVTPGPVAVKKVELQRPCLSQPPAVFGPWAARRIQMPQPVSDPVPGTP